MLDRLADGWPEHQLDARLRRVTVDRPDLMLVPAAAIETVLDALEAWPGAARGWLLHHGLADETLGRLVSRLTESDLRSRDVRSQCPQAIDRETLQIRFCNSTKRLVVLLECTPTDESERRSALPSQKGVLMIASRHASAARRTGATSRSASAPRANARSDLRSRVDARALGSRDRADPREPSDGGCLDRPGADVSGVDSLARAPGRRADRGRRTPSPAHRRHRRRGQVDVWAARGAEQCPGPLLALGGHRSRDDRRRALSATAGCSWTPRSPHKSSEPTSCI